MSHQKGQARVSYESVKQERPTKVPRKRVKQECPTMSVLQESQVRVSYTKVFKKRAK